ncbi:hypothetical protein [Paucihalobacter sp.]|uniref:hypothetical protein n=1 Tax=Paucihalobacter sp. TaxID=2850405 RepID=UPI003D16119B
MLNKLLSSFHKKAGLSPKETRKFISAMNTAVATLDPQHVKQLLQPHGKWLKQSYYDFYSECLKEFKFYTENTYPTTIEAVTLFDTQCIFCELGCRVQGFQVLYKETHEHGMQVVRSDQLGIVYKMTEGRLTDLQWCHKFLSEDEINDIKRIDLAT